jgi:hypothetical protein
MWFKLKPPHGTSEMSARDSRQVEGHMGYGSRQYIKIWDMVSTMSVFDIRQVAQKPHTPHAAFGHCAKPGEKNDGSGDKAQ